jgi:protein dithiol oxidoreductase (disulfide-forming)
MQTSSRILFLLLASFALGATAQPRESVEGVHYFALPKEVPTGLESDKIEVREVFWYGCKECSTLEPMLTEWRDGVTGDLVFARMPAVWNDLMALHARIYYTGVTLNVADRINQAAFRAVQEQQRPLRNEAEIKAFFIENGVSAEDFDKTWNAPEVIAAVDEARLRTSDYGVDKLPSVILNGRYKIVENEKVFNHVELNIAMNNLIRTLRDERRSDF